MLAHPERKLIVKRAETATDYFAYCAEMGCAVWDELKSFADALGEPVCLWLPPAMRPAGTSLYAQGVEVPVSYDGQAPEGFDIVTIPSGWLMVFQGQPYKDDKIDEAINEVQDAIEAFNPLLYGYEWADSDGPRVQWEPKGERGYIEARPVLPGKNLGIAHWI